MTAIDQSLMVVKESSYGGGGTPVKGFEFGSEGVQENEGRTEADPLRSGTWVQRSDRFTPYFAGASGPIQIDVMSKGFPFWLEHMFGQVATTGPVDSVYTHTGTMADLIGKSFAAQFGRPLHPGGTVQPALYKGGKITKWTLQQSVEANLVCTLETDYQDVDTATGLTTPSYPANMDNLTWAKAVANIGGADYDLTEFSVSVDNALNVDRRQLRGSTLKKEPTGGRRKVEWSAKADFDSMTQRNRAHATTRAGALAAIVCTWTGPILAGVSAFPQVIVTIPAGRFDQWQGANDAPEGIEQDLSGVGLYDGSASPVTLVVKSVDATP